jgi:anti-sigma B factor antagonist
MPDGNVQVIIQGEVDLATASRLRDVLLAEVSRAGEILFVDLANVGFLDARGVSALVESSLAAHRAGVRLAVRHPHGVVRRVLEAAGVATMLSLAPSNHRSRTAHSTHALGRPRASPDSSGR